MGASKRQLEDEAARAHEEYVKESICPECGDEREEVTFDGDTFWVCAGCDGDQNYEFCDDDICDEEPHTVPERRGWWAAAEKLVAERSAEKRADIVMVPVPRKLARDVVQAVAERIRYHVDGLKDDPLDDEHLANVQELVGFVKELQKLFPEVTVEF